MMKIRMTTKIMLYYFKEQARLKYMHIFTCSRKNVFSSSYWAVDIAITENTADNSSNKLKHSVVLASFRDALPRKNN